MSNITPQMQVQLAVAEQKAAHLLAVQQRNKEAARIQLQLMRTILAQMPKNVSDR